MSVYDTCESVFGAYSTSSGIPYDLQEYNATSKPAKFFIYRVVSDTDTAHYDNKPKHRTYRIQVMLFSQTKSDLRTWPDLFDTAMINAGWLPQGDGKDVDMTDTGHFGWSKSYKIFS